MSKLVVVVKSIETGALANENYLYDIEGKLMTTLENRFGERLWNTVRTSRELGYPPITFERMLSEHSPITVAKRLISSGDIQSGFKELVKLGRKDLTMEAIMLEEEFRPLFSRGELEAAAWRLEQS